MRSLLILALVGGTAAAEPIDLVNAKLAKCPKQGDDPLIADVIASSIGSVAKVDAVGNHPVTEVAQLFGPKGRAYAFFIGDGSCEVVPVAGRATAFAKGNFGGGATVAYVVRSPDCQKWRCPTVVSVKTADDRLVDALRVPACPAGADLDTLALRPGHDALVLGCWNSGGADRDRTDSVIDYDGSLASLIEERVGIAWIQTDGEPPYCVAKAPGGIAVVSAGAAPIIDVARQMSPDEVTAAKLDPTGSGCEQHVKIQRHTYDPKMRRFRPAGAPRFSVVKQLCVCPKKH